MPAPRPAPVSSCDLDTSANAHAPPLLRQRRCPDAGSLRRCCIVQTRSLLAGHAPAVGWQSDVRPYERCAPANARKAPATASHHWPWVYEQLSPSCRVPRRHLQPLGLALLLRYGKAARWAWHATVIAVMAEMGARPARTRRCHADCVAGTYSLLSSGSCSGTPVRSAAEAHADSVGITLVERSIAVVAVQIARLVPTAAHVRRAAPVRRPRRLAPKGWPLCSPEPDDVPRGPGRWQSARRVPGAARCALPAPTPALVCMAHHAQLAAGSKKSAPRSPAFSRGVNATG